MGMDSGFGGFGFMFSIFPIIFFLIFALVIGSFIYGIAMNAKRYNKNNHSPVLIVDATVVSKRTNVTHHHNNGLNDSMSHMSSSTRYYATFQVESGDRMELELIGSEFGILIEGDTGKLNFQGTRFNRFDRTY